MAGMRAMRERLHLPPLAVATSRQDTALRHGTIRKVPETEVASRYKLGQQVMESTNVGIDVILATRCSDGLEVVIKTRKRPDSFKTPEIERDWRRTTEVQLGLPKTENMCELYEVLETDSMYYIVMEKVEGKDLFELMGDSKPTWEDAREIVRQTLEALATLHRHGRIHKDLKIENVMVDLPAAGSPKAMEVLAAKRNSASAIFGRSSMSPAKAKLIDFDTVEDWEPTSPKAKEVLGTDGYIAPEAYLGEYSPASDIYAAGVVMYKVLVGEFPTRDDIFDDRPGENWVGSPQMKRIHERLKVERIDFTRAPLDKDHLAADLCAKLLAFNAGDRPSADDALAHEWFLLEKPPA